MRLSETQYELGNVVNLLITKRKYLALSDKATSTIEATIIGIYRNNRNTVLLGWKDKPKLNQFGIQAMPLNGGPFRDVYEVIDNFNEFTYYYSCNVNYLFVGDNVDSDFFAFSNIPKQGQFKFIAGKDVRVGDLISWSMNTGLYYGEVKDITEYEDPRGLPILLFDMEVFDKSGCKVFKNGCPLPSDLEVLLLGRNG